MSTPIPPVGPRRGGPPAVPPIRVLTPVERERQERERERLRRERSRRRTDAEPPSEGVDVRA
jgi:hypothetical protein